MCTATASAKAEPAGVGGDDARGVGAGPSAHRTDAKLALAAALGRHLHLEHGACRQGGGGRGRRLQDGAEQLVEERSTLAELRLQVQPLEVAPVAPQGVASLRVEQSAGHGWCEGHPLNLTPVTSALVESAALRALASASA